MMADIDVSASSDKKLVVVPAVKLEVLENPVSSAPLRVGQAPVATAASAHAVVQVIAVPPVPRDTDIALLSVDERRTACRYRFLRDRSAFITTRAAARRWLASELRLAPGEVPIVVESTGRPRLADELCSDLDFNVSHSASRAAIAVTHGRRVGVDLEYRRSIRDLRALLPDVMGPLERESLDQLDGAAFVQAFYQCWTRKEALVKALGVGIAYPLTLIDLPCVPPDGLVRLAGSARSDLSLWTLRTLELTGEYTLSCAVGASAGA